MDENTNKEIEILNELFNSIKNYISSDKYGEFTNAPDPLELKKLLNMDKTSPEEDPQTLKHWVDTYFKYSVKTHHYGFNNRMWSGANISSIVGEIASVVSQTSAGSFEAAPVSVLMEKYMIEEMLKLVGFKNGEGQMTTGSSNANMLAMMSARNLVSENLKSTGLFKQKELYAFVSEDAHYSLDKTVNILGIGLDHLVKIPVDGSGEMNTTILEEKILHVQKNGGNPFFVAATLGTTVRGAYDPLPCIVELRKKYGFWLHGDGAWGGSAVFSDTLKKKYLKDLEELDSFTMDFHKMPGTSLICNVLLFNNRPGIMDFVCNVGDKSYLHRKEDNGEDFNPGSQSLQCGRRVDSLKWFLDWKYYQKTGFARRIEKYHNLAVAGENMIEDSQELEMVVPRDSFNLCFRYKVEKDINQFNQSLRTILYKSGQTLIAYGYIGENLCLRLLLTHKEMDEQILKDLFTTIINAGNELRRNYEYN